MMDIEDLIDMAVNVGAKDFGNPDMWGILQMSYESLERFAKEVDAQARKKIENEAIRKNIVANWPYNKWVGLTDEEISDLWCKVSNTDFVTIDTHEFTRAIEAKLKEKNT